MATTVRWSPLRELEAMQRRMERLLGDGETVRPTLPSADVYETETAFVVEIEAPGFEEKEVGVEVVDHTLRVRGERKQEKEEKDKSYWRRERLERTFERRFELPTEADTEHVTASFEKGVLRVEAAKATPPKPRTVQIEKAG